MLIQPEELVPMRWGEAANAAEIGGIRHETLGLPDLQVIETPDTLCRLASLIRDVRPDVIITHDPNDYMPDHSDLAHIVLKASFVATLPHHEGVQGDVFPVVSSVFFMDTIMGVGFVPDEYVDITPAFETKKAMLACHSSQVDWLRDHDGIDVIENMSICALYRGLQCRTRYAEGFRRYAAWPRTNAERLLP
jgi:LmbE family N-acetylglucosaminyl deacetylase